MRLPPADEIVIVAGTSPIRVKNALVRGKTVSGTASHPSAISNANSGRLKRINGFPSIDRFHRLGYRITQLWRRYSD